MSDSNTLWPVVASCVMMHRRFSSTSSMPQNFLGKYRLIKEVAFCDTLENEATMNP
jgi:hypothetical protein